MNEFKPGGICKCYECKKDLEKRGAGHTGVCFVKIIKCPDDAPSSHQYMTILKYREIKNFEKDDSRLCRTKEKFLTKLSLEEMLEI